MAIKRKEGNTLVPVKAGYEAALNAKIDAVAERVSNIDVTVSVGAGLDKDSNEKLILSSHADVTTKYGQGSSDSFGHVKLTDDYTQAYTSSNGVAATPKAIQKAIEEAGGSIGDITVDWTQHGNSSLGAVQADGSLLITKSGTFTVPATGVYSVLAAGGGGNGGSVTHRDDGMYYSGAGGGGAGGYVAANLSLTKDTQINVVIGGPTGTTTFSSVTAVGGTNGGDGGSGGPGALGTSGPLGYGGSAGGLYAQTIDGTPQPSDNYWKGFGGNGASSSFPVAGGGGGAGGKFSGGSYGANGGAGGAGYGGGGGGGGGGYMLGNGVGSVAAGGAGAQGVVQVLRIS